MRALETVQTIIAIIATLIATTCTVITTKLAIEMARDKENRQRKTPNKGKRKR